MYYIYIKYTYGLKKFDLVASIIFQSSVRTFLPLGFAINGSKLAFHILSQGLLYSFQTFSLSWHFLLAQKIVDAVEVADVS